MRSSLGILALSHAAVWVLVNVGWVTVGSESLTGAQLNTTLNLLPAISLIMVFISAYKKLQRTLWISAGVITAIVALVALTSDFSSSPAVVLIFESLTGIQGATAADAGLTVSAGFVVYLTAAVSLLTLVISVAAAFAGGKRAAISAKENTQDNRSLWDEQS